MRVVIGEIVRESVTVSPTTLVEELHFKFNEQPSLEGAVVVTDKSPVGVIMKGNLFQKLSVKYGFDLFMQRSVDLLMDETMLIVNYFTPLTEAGKIAMERERERLYDYVIVEKHGDFYGVVSIRELIRKLSEVQIQIAKFSNPLSGLPGNRLINATLGNVIRKSNAFTVLYFDLDNFKTFNDVYGFSEGDHLLVETAHLIRSTINDTENSFVGHIGGDDFIAVLPNYKYESICKKIIDKFEKIVMRFYSKEDLERGYVVSTNRKGVVENIPLMSISIAVVHNANKQYTSIEKLSKDAAELKQMCKKVDGSIYIES